METETSGVLVASISKNVKEEIRISLTEFKGHDLLDIRLFYKDGEGFKPGRGITVRRQLIPELRKALAAAEKLDKAGEGVRREPAPAQGAEPERPKEDTASEV